MIRFVKDYNGPQIDKVAKELLNEMVLHKSNCLPFEDAFIWIFLYKASDEEFLGVIRRTEIKDRKYRISTLSKSKFEKIRKEREYEGDWKWDENLKKYVCYYPILGEYDPIEKKVILYVKNIEDVCVRYGVPFYCGVLTTFIHELFHAVHHVADDNGKRPYDTIKEIEEAMTEFSTLVFLKEMVDAKPESDEWEQTFKWAKRFIRLKQYCLGDLPAYGFGYYLFNAFCDPVIGDDAYGWIERYNQIIGVIDKKRYDVKRYQKMLNPVYPDKDEQLCKEILRSILFCSLEPQKSKSEMDKEQEQRMRQLEMLSEIYEKCMPPTPVFKSNHEGVSEDEVPYISTSDLHDYKYNIRVISDEDFFSTGDDAFQKKENGPIFAHYDTLEDLVADGWRLD